MLNYRKAEIFSPLFLVQKKKEKKLLINFYFMPSMKKWSMTSPKRKMSVFVDP